MCRWLAGSLFLLAACSSGERTPTVASTSQGPPAAGVAADAPGLGATTPPDGVAAPHNGESCGTDHPVILSPGHGATVAGTVLVEVRIAPDDTPCPITLRSHVQATPLRARRGGFSVFLDYGETYRWRTRTGVNGRYRITAQKACGVRLCGGMGEPVDVRVNN